jgi:methylglyoxal synthase
MDLVIYFYNPLMTSPNEPDIVDITRECDRYNIPIATNIATAEAAVLGLEQGDLDWRNSISRED